MGRLSLLAVAGSLTMLDASERMLLLSCPTSWLPVLTMTALSLEALLCPAESVAGAAPALAAPAAHSLVSEGLNRALLDSTSWPCAGLDGSGESGLRHTNVEVLSQCHLSSGDSWR